ncbi:Hachiman antiphage defense system protein HamA [Sphingomonas sp. NPDC019816]|uniref:Hachiman antiphage defense system protein HamA n=1 Tax=Sphingomonas sp. NPDC019816 TaxID=3390679 RepID=UPI003D070C17
MTLDDKKIKHEITLVKRHLDLSGLTPGAKKAMLDFLDPYGAGYPNRHDVISCLIAFDFDAFASALACMTDAEEEFCRLASVKLEETAPKIAEALKAKGIEHQEVEMFIIPVPSVATLRDLFQDKIGWKHPATEKALKKKGAGKK